MVLETGAEEASLTMNAITEQIFHLLCMKELFLQLILLNIRLSLIGMHSEMKRVPPYLPFLFKYFPS